MLRVVFVALALALATSACRLSLEDNESGSTPDGGGTKCTVSTTSSACVAADQDKAASQKLSWIEANVFQANCGTASCHSPPPGGGTPGGAIVLTTGSHAKMINVDSKLATGRKLVVPGDVAKSYLMVILQHLPLNQADPAPAPVPRDNLYMPFNTPPICCQKLDAIQRWIMAGAMND